MTNTIVNSSILADDNLPRRRTRVLDSEISYVDTGSGQPIIFLHGNPTSSYLWRNIIPHVSDLGQCFAPDLIGMGNSGKSPSGDYRFFNHSHYLDAWFDSLALNQKIILVVHDWGSALGFYWAYRHPEHVKAIAYMESFVTPLRWHDFSNGRDQVFRALRSPAGEQLVLDENLFVEKILPKSIMRNLREEEMNAYRSPFKDRESRLPTLVWPREIPIDDEPADVVKIVKNYSEWLAVSSIPKLFIAAEPGALLTGRAKEICKKWPNQQTVTVKGIHYVQEDSPAEIGSALRNFILNVEKSANKEGQ